MKSNTGLRLVPMISMTLNDIERP